MNRVFKTLWNAVRGEVVVVNEHTGTAQSKGKVRSEKATSIFSGRSVPTTLISMAVLAALETFYAPAYATYGNAPAGVVVSDKRSYCERNNVLRFNGDATITETGILSMVTYSGASFNTTSGQDINNAGVLLITSWDGGGAANFGNAQITNTGTLAFGAYQDWYTSTGHKFTANKLGSVNFNSGFSINTSGTVRNNTNVNLSGASIENTGTWYNEDSAQFTLNSGTFNNKRTLDNRGGTISFNGGTLNNTGTVYFGDTVNWGSGDYVSSSGTLITPLKHVASVGTDRQQLNVLSIDSGNAATSYSTDIWADISSSINNGFRSSSTINSGSTVTVTTALSAAQAEKVKQAIQAYFPNANVTFTNITTSGTGTNFSRSHAFDAELVNALIEGGFTNYTYYDRDWTSDLMIAKDGDGAVHGNFGIRSVAGTLNVRNGLTAELVGANGASTKLAEAALIGADSTLLLGTKSATYSTGTNGTIGSIENRGQVNARNGAFNIASYTGDGLLSASQGAEVTIAAYQSVGTVSNAGVMTFAGDASIGATTNTGTLTFSKALTVASTFNNNSGTLKLQGTLGFDDASQFENGNGTIETDFTNLFDKGTGAEINPLNTVSIGASSPEKVHVIESALFTQYLAPEIRDEVLAHMTFDDAGIVRITNVKLTQTQHDDLVNAFKEAFS